MLGLLGVVVYRSRPGVSGRFGWEGGLKKIWCCRRWVGVDLGLAYGTIVDESVRGYPTVGIRVNVG